MATVTIIEITEDTAGNATAANLVDALPAGQFILIRGVTATVTNDIPEDVEGLIIQSLVNRIRELEAQVVP